MLAKNVSPRRIEHVPAGFRIEDFTHKWPAETQRQLYMTKFQFFDRFIGQNQSKISLPVSTQKKGIPSESIFHEEFEFAIKNRKASTT